MKSYDLFRYLSGLVMGNLRAEKEHLHVMNWIFKLQTLHKKWSFPLRISSINVTKSTVSLTSVWCLYRQHWTYFTHCSGASIVDLEQVSAGWEIWPDSTLSWNFQFVSLQPCKQKYVQNEWKKIRAMREISSNT